jgi:tetratricopeptide (TPR) repeat protein
LVVVENSGETEIARLRAELLNLDSRLARAISERDALAATSARWFEAVIAISPESDLLVRARRHRRWWRRLPRFSLNCVCWRPSPLVLAYRARDTRKWELAIRYYRDALELDPGDAEIWAEWGYALKQAGKTSEGELAQRQSSELHAKRSGRGL